jgi:hypothetical protein
MSKRNRELMVCIGGSHSGDCEELCLVGYNTL